MQLHFCIAAALLFAVANSQNCSFIALAPCIAPVTISAELGEELLTTDIIESKDTLCSSMSRDDFEKLASCANNDEACRPVIFKTNETDPYFTANDPDFAGILKAELQGDANEAKRIKLFYDIICDDSCEDYLEETTSTEESQDADSMENPCAEENSNLNNTLLPLIVKYQVEELSADNLTDAELANLCDAFNRALVCSARAFTGNIGSCNTLTEAIDRTRMEQSFTTLLLQDLPTIVGSCENLVSDVYDAIFTSTSAAGIVGYSGLLMAILAVAHFF